MKDNKPTKEELEKLASKIKEDQAISSAAEKRVKLNMSFKKAVKKIVTATPSKKES